MYGDETLIHYNKTEVLKFDSVQVQNVLLTKPVIKLVSMGLCVVYGLETNQQEYSDEK